MKQDKFCCYSLNISDKFETKEKAKKEMKNIYQFLKRLILKYEKYYCISFIVIVSNTDSKTANPIYLYTGKKGRPKKQILGEKIDYHLHTYIISEKGYCSDFTNLAKNIIARKKGYKTSQNKNNNLYNAIKYLERQCDSKLTYGEYFNSQNYKDIIEKIKEKNINNPLNSLYEINNNY